MRVLVACEESARVRDAFRARGHKAWSCDVLPTAGDPTYHIQGDARDVLDRGWDLIIAFPPCTDLAVSGARHFAAKRADGRQQAAIQLFMDLASAPAPQVAVENPVGIMSNIWRKPDQIVQPYMFGDPWRKTTCLWLRGLPKLEPTNVVEHHGRMQGWHGTFNEDRRRLRSQTYPGIAAAMAEQWG